MKCCKCDAPMEEKKTVFLYLGQEIIHTVLRCPVCGQVFIPEDLAKGKIADVETMLEEK